MQRGEGYLCGAALIKSGGGTGPEKPRQPARVSALVEGAKSRGGVSGR